MLKFHFDQSPLIMVTEKKINFLLKKILSDITTVGYKRIHQPLFKVMGKISGPANQAMNVCYGVHSAEFINKLIHDSALQLGHSSVKPQATAVMRCCFMFQKLCYLQKQTRVS